MTGALRAHTALHEAVWAALGTVLDPELDEPLTDLGFVSECTVQDGRARIRLRLPTYFCAPNFAFLMVADAYDAVSAVPGITGVDVRLRDHFAAGAINKGVARRAGFVASFEGEAVNELDSLRAEFLRRAVLAGTDRVCRSLRADPVTLAGMTLGDVPPGQELDRLKDRRRELGLSHSDSAPLLVDPATDEPIKAANLTRHLGLARVTRVSQEANSGVCRGMLAARYKEEDKP